MTSICSERASWEGLRESEALPCATARTLRLKRCGVMARLGLSSALNRRDSSEKLTIDCFHNKRQRRERPCQLDQVPVLQRLAGATTQLNVEERLPTATLSQR
ncbi:unnamed protein product [Lampetra planeri]